MAAASRDCARCGVEFAPPTKGSRARFCSGACREAASKARKFGIPEASVATLPTTRPVDGDEPDVLPSLDDVARELGRALNSPHTPPTAKAALAREYRATLAELENLKPKPKDGIDELLARRARRDAG